MRTMNSSALMAGARSLWEGKGNPVVLYKRLVRELRWSEGRGGSGRGGAQQYVREQFRKHQV